MHDSPMPATQPKDKSEDDWKRDDLKRCREDLKDLDDQIKNFDREKAANVMLAELKADRMQTAARILKLETELDEEPTVDADEPDTKIKEESDGGESANPYGIRKAGDGWDVYKKDTGKKVAHHVTKEKAAAQLRLLEGVEHGWKPTGKK